MRGVLQLFHKSSFSLKPLEFLWNFSRTNIMTLARTIVELKMSHLTFYNCPINILEQF